MRANSKTAVIKPTFKFANKETSPQDSTRGLSRKHLILAGTNEASTPQFIK